MTKLFNICWKLLLLKSIKSTCFHQTFNNFVSFELLFTKLSGTDSYEKFIKQPGGHAWRHVFMVCSKLEAGGHLLHKTGLWQWYTGISVAQWHQQYQVAPLPRETLQHHSPQRYWSFIVLGIYNFGFSSPLVKLRIASFLITMITCNAKIHTHAWIKLVTENTNCRNNL